MPSTVGENIAVTVNDIGSVSVMIRGDCSVVVITDEVCVAVKVGVTRTLRPLFGGIVPFSDAGAEGVVNDAVTVTSNVGEIVTVPVIVPVIVPVGVLVLVTG